MGEPSIKIGSIVSVTSYYPDEIHIGIVTHENIWNPGGVRIKLPGNGTLECSLEKCYNTTEAERKECFKEVLKHG